MRKLTAGLMSLSIVGVLGAWAIAQQPPATPPAAGGAMTLKDVMRDAHGQSGILPKVRNDTATEEDKKNLLKMYVVMYEAKAPKAGTEGYGAEQEMDLKLKSADAVAAAAKLLLGEEGAKEKVIAATNCRNCHMTHRPPAAQN